MIHATYYGENDQPKPDAAPLKCKQIHSPTDCWSRGDQALLGTALAVGALLTAAGILGILAHLGRNVGPFNVMSSKVALPIYAMGAFGGGALIVAAVALASIKGATDYAQTERIKKILLEKREPLKTNENAKLPTQIKLKHIIQSENVYTYGRVQQYHVIFYGEQLYLFATKSGAEKKAQQLDASKHSIQQIRRAELPIETDQVTGKTESIMGEQVKYTTYSRQPKVVERRRWFYFCHGDRSVYPETIHPWERPDDSLATHRERVPKDRLRLGFAATLLAASIAAIVVPFFVQFRFAQAVQMFGIGSTAVLLYGAASGMLLKKQSDEFVTKGHDRYYRKVTSGFAYGLSRNLLNALFIGAALTLAGFLKSRYAINPIYIAPPIAAGAVALLAYTHFKGREERRRWEEGCQIDLNRSYIDNVRRFDPKPPLHESEVPYCLLNKQNNYIGNRYVVSAALRDVDRRLIIDMADIQNQAAFEGAKRQFNLSNYLLPILALVLIVAIVGTRIFLSKIPPLPIKPI